MQSSSAAVHLQTCWVFCHFLTLLLLFCRCWFGTPAQRSPTSPTSPNIGKTLWWLRCEGGVAGSPLEPELHPSRAGRSSGVLFPLLIGLIKSQRWGRGLHDSSCLLLCQTRNQLLTPDLPTVPSSAASCKPPLFLKSAMWVILIINVSSSSCVTVMSYLKATFVLGAVWRSGCGGEDHSRVKHLCGQNKGLLLAYSYISKNTVNGEPGIELNTIFVPKQNLTFVNLQVFFFFCKDDVNKVLTRGKKKVRLVLQPLSMFFHFSSQAANLEMFLKNE